MIRTETELDESPGIGSELGLPSLVGLKLGHRRLGVCIPFRGGLPGQVVLPDQGLLDGRHPLRIDRLLAVHFVHLGPRHRSVMLDVSMSTGRCTVDSRSHGRS